MSTIQSVTENHDHNTHNVMIILKWFLMITELQVRESIDPDAPENAIDVVTNAKVRSFSTATSYTYTVQ